MKKPRAKRAKRPKHPGEVRAWRFALRLDQDVSALHRALDAAWALRNDLAAARTENGRAIRAAKEAGLTPPPRLTKRDQEQALAERRRRDPKGAGALHSLVVKNIADRIDEGWGRFWDACKERRPNVRPPRPIRRALAGPSTRTATAGSTRATRATPTSWSGATTTPIASVALASTA